MIRLRVIGDNSRLSEFCDEVDMSDHYLVIEYSKSENFKGVSIVILEPQTKLAEYMDAAYILKNIATKFGYDIL